MILESQVWSHGYWPVKKLRIGQTIRFRSRNYGQTEIVKVSQIRQFGQMVVVFGTAGGSVAFGLEDRVELVTAPEDRAAG